MPGLALRGSGTDTYVRTVSMERDLRADPETFTRSAGMDLKVFHARHGASGLIRCGAATGSGQVTLSGGVVTTAAHVFIGAGGKRRSESCSFEPLSEPGRFIAIDMRSIVTGSPRPMEQRATLDWAVARLASVPGKALPYRVAPASDTPSAVTMFGGGFGGAGRMGVERCSTRAVTAVSPEGIRELSFDCSASHGGSGAALLSDENEMVGMFVGYRSVDMTAARPFSGSHYNFAITVEGPFRRALLDAASTR